MQAHFANGIVNFVKKTNLSQNVTSNKTKHVLVKNELDELSKKVEAISG